MAEEEALAVQEDRRTRGAGKMREDILKKEIPHIAKCGKGILSKAIGNGY